ncbi:MAG: hypothetical protein ACRDFT_02010 [bacterium]
MRTFLKWTGRILGGLAVLLVLAAMVVYVLSLRVLAPPAGVAGSDVPVPVDSAAVAEGGRLAAVRGCPGCHGEDVRGRVFVEDPLLGRVIAPRLPDLAREAPAAKLERVIRRGVGVDGRALIAMPSEMYFDLRGVGKTPSLAVAAGYSPAECETFVRTGTAKGGRELAMMSAWRAGGCPT